MFEQRTLYTTRVRITLDEGADQNHPLRCTIVVLDPALRDHSATFRIVQRVRVHDSRGIGQTGFPFEREIRKLGPQQIIDIPREALRVYSYKGSMIDVQVVAELIVDDGFFSNTEITISEAALIDRPPAIASQLDEIVDPSDAFNFLVNLAAIPPVNRMTFLRGEVRFEPMFRALYPRQMTSSTHGVDLHWEIQLIHDELIDQELICPCESFIWEEFVEA